MRKTIRLVYDIPEFTRWESDWIQYLLRDFNVITILDADHRVVDENVILAVSFSSPEQAPKIAGHLQMFKRQGLSAGVLHLSDEFGSAPLDFYRDAAFVFRNYYRRPAMRKWNARYLCLGYKSGFTKCIQERAIADRRIVWSFAGQLKTTRAAMLLQANAIAGGFHHLTTQWNDPAALDTQRYAEMLNDTVFALCPRGNRAVDCFRVYEALEAGAIPIVEDRSTMGSIGDLLRPGGTRLFSKFGPRDCVSNLRNHGLTSYWTAAYGPDFPCPRINYWENLGEVMRSINVEETAGRVRRWWREYKDTLTARVAEAVSRTFTE